MIELIHKWRVDHKGQPLRMTVSETVYKMTLGVSINGEYHEKGGWEPALKPKAAPPPLKKEPDPFYGHTQEEWEAFSPQKRTAVKKKFEMKG